MPNIVIERNRNGFALYVDGKFYCTCDDMSEVKEEMEAINENYRKKVPCFA